MKYIDAELLREEIERLKEEYNEQVSARLISESLVPMGKVEALNKILSFIDSLQHEQPSLPDNLDEIAEELAENEAYGKSDAEFEMAYKGFKAGAQWMKDQLTRK